MDYYYMVWTVVMPLAKFESRRLQGLNWPSEYEEMWNGCHSRTVFDGGLHFNVINGWLDLLDPPDTLGNTNWPRVGAGWFGANDPCWNYYDLNLWTDRPSTDSFSDPLSEARHMMIALMVSQQNALMLYQQCVKLIHFGRRGIPDGADLP